MPVLRTMYALTHCQIMSLSAKDFKYITLKYPSLNDSIQQTRQEMLQAEAFAKIIEVKDTYKFATLFKTQKVQHFVYFDASRGAEYYKVFPKWCWPLRYIIIPCTFTPYGNFVKYWEISRSIFAMANIILLPVDIIFIKETYFWRSILVFLDLMAWIDIYARLHIIYFTNVGIEVTHPIKTAKHYILNGFLLDFISVFPIERILRLTAIHISIKKYTYDTIMPSLFLCIYIILYFLGTVGVIDYCKYADYSVS